MKSRLRSRWYRPNEKPLETASKSQKNKEPFGEISSINEKLVDDLSNAKPPSRSESSRQSTRSAKSGYNESSDNRNSRSRSHKPKNPNRDSKRHEGNTENKGTGNSNNDRSPQKNHQKRSDSSSVNKKPRRRNNKNRTENKNNERGDRSYFKTEEKSAPKKSGLSGFISKLFGG